MTYSPVPYSTNELLQRCEQLAGCTLGELASQNDFILPGNLTAGKGKVGQLIEKCLGASAGNKACPDFPELGIELKTLPVAKTGRPSESTYVCTAPLTAIEPYWETSWLRQKLACVLWVPIESDPGLTVLERRVGRCTLWRPSTEEESLLRQDWEILTEYLWFGGLEYLDATVGDILQIRPKAAHSKILCHLDETQSTGPKGFYLKPCFTKRFL